MIECVYSSVGMLWQRNADRLGEIADLLSIYPLQFPRGLARIELVSALRDWRLMT
jgi:hypothetical protein